jgi:hypothetical protein
MQLSHQLKSVNTMAESQKLNDESRWSECEQRLEALQVQHESTLRKLRQADESKQKLEEQFDGLKVLSHSSFISVLFLLPLFVFQF